MHAQCLQAISKSLVWNIDKPLLQQHMAQSDWRLHWLQNSCLIFHLDVKSTFLPIDWEKQVYIDHPSSYVKIDNEHKAYRLKHALYRLKQAPCAWYSLVDTYFLAEGFKNVHMSIKLVMEDSLCGYMLMIFYLMEIIVTCLKKFKESMMLSLKCLILE